MRSLRKCHPGGKDQQHRRSLSVVPGMQKASGCPSRRQDQRLYQPFHRRQCDLRLGTNSCKITQCNIPLSKTNVIENVVLNENRQKRGSTKNTCPSQKLVLPGIIDKIRQACQPDFMMISKARECSGSDYRVPDA